jgi:acyl-CoA reductase-like NAD-dependent aldehyde dehydrogenase
MGKQHKRWVEKEPVGVVAAIIGYNYPNQLALAKLSPALAAGCTVVLKAAPQTPLITLAIAELIANETEIPPGVVNIISSSSPAVGQVLTTSPDVDAITFTGSTATGRKIMAAGADTIKRVFLELGGKSAMVVLDDADTSMLPLTAAFTACSHAGQGCAITTRLVVPREKHDEIVAGVAGAMGHVKYGDPFEESNYMGPLITEEQRDKVHGLVERAVADGATLVCGGKKKDGPGYYYEPTLLANVNPDSEVAQTEAFGPVLVVIPHDGDDDAVAIANNSIYGLSGGVMSADEDRAISVARRIRTGTMGINGGAWFGPDSPFGGFKQSGVGREMGVAGLEEFLEGKTLAVPVAQAGEAK